MKAIREPSPTREATALRQILVATDFSDNANLALNWAIEVAKANRAHIALIHAIEMGQVDEGKALEQHHKAVQQNLEKARTLVHACQLDMVVERAFRRVLVAVDFSEASVVAARTAVQLLFKQSKAPGMVMLLHVCELELP